MPNMNAAIGVSTAAVFICRTAATGYQARPSESAEFSNQAYIDLMAIYRSNDGRLCGLV